MSKKKRGVSLSAPADQVLVGLVERALQQDLQSDGPLPFLEELRPLTPGALFQFATSLAQRGQEKALPFLLALSQQEGTAEAAVEALGWIKSQEAVRCLGELSQAASPRKVRKAAGRGLHRLRSLGFTTEAAPATAGMAAVASIQDRPRPRAWASAVDGRGSRFFFLSLPQPLGGRALVFLMLNDQEGIQEARATHIQEDREALARVETVARESRLPHVEIPFDYARYLMGEGRERAQAAGRALPTEYLVWKELLGEPEGSWELPPVYQGLNSAQIILEPRLLEESSRLLDLREFLSWRLETERMRPYAMELEQARLGTIVLPEAARGERGERVLAKVLADLLSGDGRSRYKRRLEEMAYLLLHTGRERQAKWALAAALALEQEPRQGSIYLPGSRPMDLALGEAAPFARHPFFRRLAGESLERARDEMSRSRKVLTVG